MRNILLSSFFVLFVFSCQSKRFRDNKGVYIYNDSCVVSHDETQSDIYYINGIAYPSTYVIEKCDSSIVVKTYLGK